METTARALAHGPVETPEHARHVLEQRARQLAKPPAAPPGDAVELLLFALASEAFGIESRHVIAVFRTADLTPLPGAAPPVIGVTAWRGELLTILDLRQVLGVSHAALTDLSRVVVLGGERPSFGILADAVHEMVTLPASAISAPPEGVAANRDYLRGVTGGAVLVLAAEKLLQFGRPSSS